MIDRHYKSLHDHPRYGRCHVRVFVEANMSFIDSDRIANQLRDPKFGSVEVVKFDPNKKNRYGIWTNGDSKNVYCSEIQRAAGTLLIADEFVAHPREREGNIEELWKQLKEFRLEVKTTGDKISVERTGKGPGMKDDIFMALGIALCYAYRSLDEWAFRQRMEERGLAAA